MMDHARDPDQVRLDPVEQAIADIAAGRAVVVVDDEDRENEGDLIFAAQRATPELAGFMIRHTSGVICVAMTGPDLDRLALPPMTMVNEDRKGTAYAVSVDSRDGITTGISAADRAHTIRVLADSATEPNEITRPGHVFPLRAAVGGVLRRPGHTEAAVDLARLAGLSPGRGDLRDRPRRRLDDAGTAAARVRRRARPHDDLDRRPHRARPAHRAPGRAGGHDAAAHAVRRPSPRIGYRDTITGTDHVALVCGDIGDGDDVLVRVHSRVPDRRRARVDPVRLRRRSSPRPCSGSPTRGAGWCSTCAATRAAGSGCCTSCAPTSCRTPAPTPCRPTSSSGCPPTPATTAPGRRSWPTSASARMRLLTNNPTKRAGLEGYGLTIVGREPLPPAVTDANVRYLTTKRDLMGHELPDLDDARHAKEAAR